MISQRRKNDISRKGDSDVVQTASRPRQKRGSLSHAPLSSVADTYEDDVQCNGVSTSCNKISKSCTVSTLSSTDVGCHRRSSRLVSHFEPQHTVQTPEKKKKKDDDSKIVKDKQKLLSSVSSEKISEKSFSKRTSVKSKNLGETPVNDHLRDSEEGDEPVEKRPKRNSRKSFQKDMYLEKGSREDNGSGTEQNNVEITLKRNKKQTSKQTTSSEQTVLSEHYVKDCPSSSQIQDNENEDQDVSRQKKSILSHMSSDIETILECKNEIDIDLKYYLAHKKRKSKSTSDHTSKVCKPDIVAKECQIVKSISPANKEDVVMEYNRSISEKISLLKPKAFIGRSSTSFRKTVDDQGEGSGQEIDSDAESRRAIRESAQRRIEQNLSTSESDSRYFRGLHTPVAHSSKNDSSESDSAPEVVSFAAARHEAIETIKSAAEHVKREKQRLKERRKARLEMLKQQKEEKLIRLKEKMASQEDASCSSSEESGYEEEIRNARLKLKKKKAKSKSQRTEKENFDDGTGQVSMKAHSGAASDDSSDEDFNPPQEATSFSSLKQVQTEMFQSATEAAQSAKTQKVGSSSNKNSYDDNLKKKKKSKPGKLDDCDRKDRGFKNLTSLDYIPLSSEGATKFMVVPLDKAMRAPKSLAEEAANFRQNMLYGSRIKREPAKIISQHKQKIIASGKNFHVR